MRYLNKVMCEELRRGDACTYGMPTTLIMINRRADAEERISFGHPKGSATNPGPCFSQNDVWRYNIVFLHKCIDIFLRNVM